MPRYEHLTLVRVQEPLPRRKRPGFGNRVQRDNTQHGTRLTTELDTAVATQRGRRPFVDPSLILRVQMSQGLLEDQWQQLGLTVLSSDADRTLVLFSSENDIADLRNRLAGYSVAAPPGNNPAYYGFVEQIESIGSVEPRDRIGRSAREEGFAVPDDFVNTDIYVLDIELWELGNHNSRTQKLEQLSAYLAQLGGEELDRYVGAAITMLRVRCSGSIVKSLLNIDVIAEIDLPPQVDSTTGELLDLVLDDLPPIDAVDESAPLIGIIDSGVNAHPLIEDIVDGGIAEPDYLGIADEFGHGTNVAGVAVFGNLREKLGNAALNRGARLCYAKVLNERGQFPDRSLTPKQMRAAISRLHQEYGCRIFVVALCDRRKLFDGKKVGPWAATLDELVAELNIVIVVSAGNRDNIRREADIEEAVTNYPNYLMETGNRLVEPGGALNVITVGSLAHGNGLGPREAADVRVQPITNFQEPSPFTRIGPGVENAIKPDFVDVGGTLIFDPYLRRLRGGDQVPEAGVLTLHSRPLERLFSTCSGTSFSAPLVAHKAAQLLAQFPNASANLVRALLANGASVPIEAAEKLAALGEAAQSAVCGHGMIDPERAGFSDDNRVVFYVEDSLAIDHFAVFQIPIPELFQTERGRRTIRVSLAYDPPVRHTRRDYAGVSMGYRLLRGCNSDFIFEHYRQRRNNEEPFPKLLSSFDCSMEPSITKRENGSLQTGMATFLRPIERYGDTYHLVVHCMNGWADVAEQRFAAVVELAHEAQIQIYQRLRVRV